jgi:hypothetical protein
MKNILVKSLYKIKDPNWGVKNRQNETNLYDKYLECHDISLESFKKYVNGTCDYVFFSGDAETIHNALYNNFQNIYQLWKDEYPCNLLYTDPDTLAVNTVEPWNQYNKFMMFNFSDPRSFYRDNIYGLKFANFFNAGVRYFPATMSLDTWNIGLELAKNWNTESYDTEQIILNQMMWSQGLKLSEVVRPAMNFQAAWMNASSRQQNLWNGINIQQAHILHFHGSRNVNDTLELMKKVTTR